MPLGEPQASSALPPRIMHHRYRSILDDMVTGTSQSPAKVHVLIVEIKLLIESPNLRERLTAHEKKHACQPVGIKQTRRCVGICAVMPAEGLGRETEHGREPAGTVFGCSIRTDNLRGAQRRRLVIERPQQDRKGISLKADIRIENTNERRGCISQCSVVVGSISRAGLRFYEPRVFDPWGKPRPRECSA